MNHNYYLKNCFINKYMEIESLVPLIMTKRILIPKYSILFSCTNNLLKTIIKISLDKRSGYNNYFRIIV